MSEDIKELVKRLRDGDCLDIGAAADALETLAKELYDARVVCGDTFDSARKWRAQAEAAEAERDRLKAVLKPRLNAKAIEGLQEILEAMEAMDEREAPFLKTLLDWHEASRKALGDAS